MCKVVYQIECERRTGNNIGEIARSPCTRIKEHQFRDTSAVLEHCRATGTAKRSKDGTVIYFKVCNKLCGKMQGETL